MICAYRASLVSTARRGIVYFPEARAASKPSSLGRKCLSQTTAGSSSGSIWTFPKDNPFLFQMIVATTKTSAADLVVQMVAEGKSLAEVDWKRNAIFVVFGFAYLGGFQWYLMVNKYRQWFPTMDKFAKMSFAEKLKYPAGILDAAKMVLFDITIHLPLMYFPTYYTVKECVGGNSWNPMDWMKDGLSKYANVSVYLERLQTVCCIANAHSRVVFCIFALV